MQKWLENGLRSRESCCSGMGRAKPIDLEESWDRRNAKNEKPQCRRGNVHADRFKPAIETFTNLPRDSISNGWARSKTMVGRRLWVGRYGLQISVGLQRGARAPKPNMTHGVQHYCRLR